MEPPKPQRHLHSVTAVGAPLVALAGAAYRAPPLLMLPHRAEPATSAARPDQATLPTPAIAAELPGALAVARRLLGCDHLAADAVQEALVALWREASSPTDLRGWLVRAVVFRARHLRRTLARRHKHEHGAAVHCELHAGCDNPLHHAYAHELGHRLDAALAELPSEQRTAFQLYVDTGLDYQGIAQRLALPVGTVRSRLHRARQALQEALGESLHGD